MLRINAQHAGGGKKDFRIGFSDTKRGTVGHGIKKASEPETAQYHGKIPVEIARNPHAEMARELFDYRKRRRHAFAGTRETIFSHISCTADCLYGADCTLADKIPHFQSYFCMHKLVKRTAGPYRARQCERTLSIYICVAENRRRHIHTTGGVCLGYDMRPMTPRHIECAAKIKNQSSDLLRESHNLRFQVF